jgi:hypothetical protein
MILACVPKFDESLLPKWLSSGLLLRIVATSWLASGSVERVCFGSGRRWLSPRSSAPGLIVVSANRVWSAAASPQ